MSGLTHAVRSFRNIWGHGDDDYADEPEDDAEAEQASPSSQQTTYTTQRPAPAYGGGSGGSHGGSHATPRRLSAVPAPSHLRSREKNIYTIKPKTQDDAAIAADYLKTGDAVIINLDDVDRANAIRIIDFMSGVCYGVDGGHAMKLGDAIFLYTPPDFEIRSDEVDYGENQDYFFKDVQAQPATPQPQTQVQAQTQAPQSYMTAQGYTNPAVLPQSPQQAPQNGAPAAGTIPNAAVSAMPARNSYVDARRPWER